MLIAPLNSFPWVINGLVQAWVSLRRLQGYLNLKNLSWYSYYKLKSTPTSSEDSNILINVKNASFKWNKAKKPSNDDDNDDKKKKKDDEIKKRKTDTASLVINNVENEDLLATSAALVAGNDDCSNTSTSNNNNNQIILSDISFKIEKNKFIGVIGKVGRGKSSLLNAILAELTKVVQNELLVPSDTNEIEIDRNLLANGFAYAAQDTWIQATTIRDNILFGQSFDDEKYKNVIYACALSEDLQLLPKNDETPVGESGVTLSGGQKARLCLARACYQDKPLYLLDDPLSAVDTHVAKHIYDHCINGILANKTRILCTHHLKYLLNADHVIVIDNNKIIKQGLPKDIIPECMNSCLLTKDNDSLKDSEDNVTVDFKVNDSVSSNLAHNRDNDEYNDEAERHNDNERLLNAIKAKNELDDIEIKENDEEQKERGIISFKVYKYYCKSIGIFLSILIIVSLMLMQASRNTTDWWLSYWTQHHHASNLTIIKNSSFNNSDIKLFFIVYASLGVANSLFTLIRAFSFAYSCIIAGKYIHNTLIKSLINARVKFFDLTPRGRILNRVSSDMYAIDDSLPFILNILLAVTVGLIGILAITCYSLPWFSVALIPLSIIYYMIQNYYRWTSRELKRLSSISLSPVYTHFHETLTGLVTIRSFREIKRFLKKHEHYLHNYIRSSYVSMAASQWLNFRLQMIGVAMITIVSFIGIVQHIYGSNVNASLIGLALSYILSVTGILNGLITSFTETEKEMVSVERAHQFQNLESENWIGIELVDDNWPVNSTIEFHNVCLRYQPDAPNALDDVSFKVNQGEKIGIVGRTGSGKSSLFMALYRAFEVNHGQILIDNRNIRNIDLVKLRQQLSIIPQDPFLFSGTLRENLDPYNKRTDNEIWHVLDKCRLSEKIRNLNEGLELIVEERGKNFSSGEKQLVCLARAILSQTKILCIDEATASVDFETDNFIQETIRYEFKNVTVLTIAHRINTIFDYDKVIVMKNAKIIEFDTINNLLANRESYFYDLVDTERKQQRQQMAKMRKQHTTS